MKERILAILEKYIGTPDNGVTDDTLLMGKDGYDADSLDMIEVTMAIEDEFHIELSDEAVEQAKTVGQLVALVEGLV